MEIVRKSQISGKEHAMDLNITREQVEAYNNGALLQDAFPNLNAEEREFYKSGITPQEWNDLFGPEEEDDEPGVGDHVIVNDDYQAMIVDFNDGLVGVEDQDGDYFQVEAKLIKLDI